AQVAFVDQLARLANIYTDTAGVRRFDLLADAIRRAGPAKVLFGSDGPWLHPGVELAKVGFLGLRPEAESQILSGNFLRLIEHAGQRPGAAPHQHPAAAEPFPLPAAAPGQLARTERGDPWLSRPALR